MECTSVNGASHDKYAKPRTEHYLWTYGSTLFILVCNLLAYRLSNQFLGEQGFAEYAVGRRTLSYGYPILMQCLGVAITHHVAARGTDSQDSERGYFKAAAVLLGAAALLVVVPANLCSAQVSFLFFGDVAHAALVPPISLMFVGVCTTTLAANFLLGRMEIATSSLITIGSGLTPLLALTLVGQSTAQVFAWTGIGYLLISSIALFGQVIPRLEDEPLGPGAFEVHLRRLWEYAAPRIPGALALSVLLGVPVTLTSHFGDLQVAGVIALGGTMLTVAGALVNPLAMILVPQSTRMLRTGQGEDLRRHFLVLLRWITAVMSLGVVVGFLGLKPALTLYLGHKLAASSNALYWMLPTVVPYAWFFGFRSILDGAHRKAVNAHNTYLALGCLATVTVVARWLHGPQPVLLGFLCGIWTLGLATLWRTWRVFESDVNKTEANL